MTTGQLINSREDFLGEAMEGFELAYGDLVRWHRQPSYVVRREPASPEKVALVSGGGSGHEPMHAGFVGTGMLDAAVPGAVFASPTANQIRQATAAVAGSAGVLHIVKNYTGDVLNFGLAAERLRGAGVALETVVVNDDLATAAHDQDDPDAPGGRGTAATVTVEKICGAAAERGADLATVAALGRRVVDTSRSLAFAVSGCRHPGEDTASFEVPPGELEFGIGIHGERGTGRRPMTAAAELFDSMVEPLVASLAIPPGAPVIAIVNNLGGTPPLELYLAYREVSRALRERGIVVARSLVGAYVTALDMRGCSVTLTAADDELLGLWDSQVRTPALRW